MGGVGSMYNCILKVFFSKNDTESDRGSKFNNNCTTLGL